MKKLLAIIVLSLCFITPSQADDIRDFQVEGMSVGDSFLNYMTKREIKSSKRNYVKNKRYYVVGYGKGLDVFESVDVYLKTGDKNYIIKSISGTIFLNFKDCTIKKKEVVRDIQNLFPNTTPTHGKSGHSFDKSGKSIVDQTGFLLKNNDPNDDHIRVECIDWSKKFEKKRWKDNISVTAYSKEVLQWFLDGYN